MKGTTYIYITSLTILNYIQNKPQTNTTNLMRTSKSSTKVLQSGKNLAVKISSVGGAVGGRPFTPFRSMFLYRIAPNLYRDLCPIRVCDTSHTQHRHRRHHEQIRCRLPQP